MKLHHFSIIILLCALAWHCSDQDSSILAVNTMKKVMLHKIMAEERFINYLQRDSMDNEDSALTELFAGVLAYHKTDSATFYRSLEYYKANPIIFNVLLDSLSNYAQAERDRQYLNMNPPLADLTVSDSTVRDSTLKNVNVKDSIPKDSTLKNASDNDSISKVKTTKN